MPRGFPHLTITLLGDGDYACVKLCVVSQRLVIGLVTRMRDDSRPYDRKTRYYEPSLPTRNFLNAQNPGKRSFMIESIVTERVM